MRDRAKARRVVASAVVATGLVLAAGVAAQEPGDATGTFDLYGVVREDGTERPVALAMVEAVEVGRAVLTDSAGRFVIRDLPEGANTFRTSALGYVENLEASEVRRGDAIVVRLLPKPMAVEGITVVVGSLERRRNQVASSSRLLRRRDLALSGAPTVADVLRDRYGVSIVTCPGSQLAECVRDRGRPRSVRVWLDEHPVAGGASLLELYAPHEIERLEYYPGLGQIRVYTAQFLEELARTGRTLMPICVVCG